jgi:malonyl-CoA O-methyltransferase
MLQWSNTPGEVFSESYRVLKKNRYAIFATLTDGTLQELKESFSAIDPLDHVSDFLPASEIIAWAESSGFTLKQARQETVVENYEDVVGLMRSLKAIGARHKSENQRKSLLTPRALAKLEQAYRARYATKQGIAASWHILLLVLGKD